VRISTKIAIFLALGTVGNGTGALADALCATPEQSRQIQAFYKDKPATMPVIAARKLQLPEAVVVSGLPADQAAGVKGEAFTDVWAAMTTWQEAVFLITKGDNVFEVVSPIAPATPSKSSQYTNIAYEHPLRGHLRPDQFRSIYAVAMPGKDGAMARGVLFYDADGASVFGAFISGEGPPPPASEIAKFDELMRLVTARPQVCPDT
jgi:putative heme iron utilization protein